MAHHLYGYHSVKTALILAPYQVKKLYLLESRQDKRIQEILELAEELNIPMELLPRKTLDKKLPDVTHQGIIADVVETKMQTQDFLKKLSPKVDGHALFLILDGIQDPQNLGACLRSANGLGAHAVIIPKHHSTKLTETVQKVSCGASWVTPLIQVNNLAQILTWLKKEGVWLVGADIETDTPIGDIDLKGNIALILGNESEGLRHLTKQKCDFLAHIPMSGTVQSLNVSAATAICLYEALRQRTNISKD